VGCSRENAAIDRLLRRQPFISSGGPQRREIAITFDDGPGPYTPGLLAQLQRLHVPATFFEVGFKLRYFSGSLRRELRMGAGIGNHTETHPIMAHLTASQQTSQLLAQREQLARYGARFSRLYRPPYGSFNRATLAILHRLHMLMVLWSVDTQDYPAGRRSDRSSRAGRRAARRDHPHARRGRHPHRNDRRATPDRACATRPRLPARHDPPADPRRPTTPSPGDTNLPHRRLTLAREQRRRPPTLVLAGESVNGRGRGGQRIFLSRSHKLRKRSASGYPRAPCAGAHGVDRAWARCRADSSRGLRAWIARAGRITLIGACSSMNMTQIWGNAVYRPSAIISAGMRSSALSQS